MGENNKDSTQIHITVIVGEFLPALTLLMGVKALSTYLTEFNEARVTSLSPFIKLVLQSNNLGLSQLLDLVLGNLRKGNTA